LRRALWWLRRGAHVSALTIVGALVAAYLLLPPAQSHLGSAGTEFSSIFLAAGGMVGTILALVFSLSIIAVQRAAEAFSPSIAWLYRDDARTQLVFCTLASFCMLSFIMGAGAIAGLSDATLLPIQLLLVGITFDLLRWHYRGLAQLLLPSEAIRRLVGVIRRQVGKTQSMVERRARAWLRALPEDQQGAVSARQLEAGVYARLPNHAIQLTTWAGELAEAATKAIAREESHAARLAIWGLAEAATCYVTARRGNLTLGPSPSLLGTAMGMASSDADAVLKPVYERLKDISRRAVTQGAETTCLDVVDAFGRIVSTVSTLDSPAFAVAHGGRRAPISWLPLGYLKDCALSAQRRGLHDVALRSAATVTTVLHATPITVPLMDVFRDGVEGLRELAAQSLAMQQSALANEVLRSMLAAMHDALARGNAQVVEMVHVTLGEVRTLAPLALASAATTGATSLGMPLSPAYDLAFPHSVGRLVVASAERVLSTYPKDGPGESRRFDLISETVSRHLRSVADGVDGLATTFLVFYIAQTIREICDAHLAVIRSLEPTDPLRRRLAGHVSWHLSFFWVAFGKPPTVHASYAHEACDTLAHAGLGFTDIGDISVAKSSVSGIYSVAKSHWAASRGCEPHTAADLLSCAYCIRRLAEARSQTELVEYVDEGLNDVVAQVGDGWSEVESAYRREVARIEEAIRTPDIDLALRGGAVLLLAKLLRQTDHEPEECSPN
jgi:hypothetical protein